MYKLAKIRRILLFIYVLFLFSCNISKDPYDELYDAIRKGDSKKVSSIVKSGINLNPLNKNWTPLMIAVLRKNIDIIEIFLKNGADINFRNNKGQTPLHIASRWGHPEVVDYLIKNGTLIESRDWLSWTPIMWASLRGKTEVVEVLIRNGANVNVRDIDGNTPLILASWHGHKNTIKLLLSYNADKKAKNIEGLSACDILKKKGFIDVLSIIGKCE